MVRQEALPIALLDLLSLETNPMSFITYPQENGQVAVVSLATGVTVEEAISSSIPENTPYKIVESLDIDDSYFDAYEFNPETGAEINIAKAKQIHLDKFRAARAPKLAKLDIDYMRALEVEDSVKASQIAIAKQELRDVTKIELPDTLPEIKETWPSILN
jgi:tRNA U34 5-methylaminomethyl-2-thiouridine-forming methyltransferase MnmC